MFAVIGSTSTNTGFKLFQTIELAVAKNENGEVITSPLIFIILRAIMRPIVQLETSETYGTS